MPDLVTTVAPAVRKTIKALSKRPFKPDPIAGARLSKIVSIVSSAYKRHGHIIELAIYNKLKEYSDLEVWSDKNFQVSAQADLLVAGSLTHPLSLIGSQLNYTTPGARRLQIDLFVYNKLDKSLGAYEIKRGFGTHDAGKKRSILRDTLCVQVLLKDYGVQKGLDVQSVSSHVIFFYNNISIPLPFAVKGNELDAHFGFSVLEDVERVNVFYKDQLISMFEE